MEWKYVFIELYTKKTITMDLTGMEFGRLTVYAYSGKNKSGINLWACKCSCGNNTIVSRHELRSGDTNSCGCLRREVSKNRFLTHGKRYSKEYQIWLSMKDRCLNKNNISYSNYGGRGIKICDEWISSFEKFYQDMGQSPGKEYSIDRIDNNKFYSKENCKWSTRHEQSNNRRVTIIVEYMGEKLPLSDMCVKVGISYECARQRINKYGWSVFDTFSKPVGQARNFKKNKNINKA